MSALTALAIYPFFNGMEALMLTLGNDLPCSVKYANPAYLMQEAGWRGLPREIGPVCPAANREAGAMIE
jgi:hypothetical protein